MNIQEYSIALLTSFERNKNTSAVARELGESQSTLSRHLKNFNIDISTFKPLIKHVFGKKGLIFGCDDTTITKRYANLIEGTASMFDQATKTFANCYSILAGCLTDGKHLLPIEAKQWVPKSIMQDEYLTKAQVAEKLVTIILSYGLNIQYFVFDGLYSTITFMNFLNDQYCKFVMKIRNTTVVEFNGELVRLSECQALRLNSNQSQKTIYAKWKGKFWYFTAVRRSGKHGPKIIYLVANFKTKARIYVRIYDSRWGVEKLFRTGKQSLGISASSSRFSNVYLNHIKCVFVAYGFLQVIQKKFRLGSAEDAIRKIQSLKLKRRSSYNRLKQSFLEIYA